MADYTSQAFFSADAKFAWGEEHLHALQQEIIDWSEKHPLAMVMQSNADATEYLGYLQDTEDPPFTRWSLILGDGLQAFRSVLDHAIYALASAHSRQDPPPSSKILAFPITDNNCNFAKALWRLGELNTDKSITEAIGELQPYNRPHMPPCCVTSTVFINIESSISHEQRRKTQIPPGTTADTWLFSHGSITDVTCVSNQQK
jgi:hypothetical protein